MAGLSHLLSQLDEKSILDLLPDLRKLFLERGKLELFEENRRLCEQGKPNYNLMIPLSDNVRLVDESNYSAPKFIGYLQKNRSLCLREILEGKVAPYSAIAEIATSVLTLPTACINEFLDTRHKERRYLVLMTSSTGCRSFKHYLTEKGISQEKLFSIFEKFSLTTQELKEGEVLTFDQKPSLFLVDEGQIELRSVSNSQQPFVAQLGSGMWFGGEAIVPPRRYSYLATARSVCRLQRLTLQDLEKELTGSSLIENLQAEPWIGKSKELILKKSADELTSLPGRVLSEEETLRSGVSFDSDKIRGANADAESVLASLANLSLALRVPINLSAIETDLSIRGKTTLLSIAEAIERFGLIASPLKCKISELSRQRCPSLILYGPRLCLLLKVNRDNAILLDPGIGCVEVTNDQLQKHWQELLLEVLPAKTDLIQEIREEEGSNEKKGKKTRKEDNSVNQKIFRALWEPIWEHKSLHFNRLALLFLGLGLGLITPKISQFMIDEVLTLKQMSTLWVLAIGSFLLAFFQAVFSVANVYLQGELSLRISRSLNSLFFRHAIEAKRSAQTSRGVGDILNRMNEMETFHGFVTEGVYTLLSQGLSLLFYGVMLFKYHTGMACLGLGVLPVVFVIRYAYTKILKLNWDKSFLVSGQSTSQIAEQIGAIATIKASNSETIKRRQWEENQVEGGKLHRQNNLLSAQMETLVGLGTLAIQSLGLWIGFDLALEGKVSVGEVMAINMYFGNLVGPAKGLASLLTSIEQVKVSFRRIADVFLLDRDESKDKAAITHSKVLSGKIKIDRLFFKYEEESPWVLEGINFTIYPKQTVAIVGRSGCGKTTLAKLIANELMPSTGKIYFDDYDSGLLSYSSLRSQIGVIMQENDLFSGSIQDNIAYADDALDTDVVSQAATSSGASKFIEELPGGYQYYLHEGGLGLSGGQKQRISIAQALYRSPRILIMDEATSALDGESEQIIVEKMKEILADKTTIIIAHRLSTIRRADRILVMRDGKIVEEGTHTTLMQKGGHYADLFKDQVSAGEA